ncbi:MULTISPECIES: TauD/TfdA dioxygenase family protein [Mycobacteriaceae]|uniref:Taurine catabolism dioxygenase TauD, TfdA family protein n=3 Tax=Mycobacteriaceae TaxID=1762 RepID=A0A378U9W5_MYCFO|nr:MULTISPECIES: TauD/TfdA family dioxygenase [Mycobacteriaceae]AIY49498.1 Alpha-ketoglutarate-dependent taurine dioxygenase [Mycobacterium sp. VKM Ac-1817D]CRL79538.1 putative taurine catabolism dioxygenase [Mycolicibacter nonchromogenicus]EJZ09786.1 taurine catabolism dioxygenase TauD/TfdA [Mycolicibacterium fortuitum subsp. fortuitum DSM 46621 = ATCC 6841 = JCM 6387]MCG7609014.1 TauD/TfdA family dioxygenase [Mycobacterium sp. CnD-18-1]OHT96465.1 taurine catabolism dioxygenase TauD [Mycobact
MTIATTPISDAIGVEVTGYTTADFLDPGAAQHCHVLLERHGVVVYREAHISDPDLVAFSRALGEVVVAGAGGHPDYPEISPVTLDPSRSALAGLRRSTIFWHTDGLTDQVPQKATLLTAREVADEGGDTEFANTYAAFEALPADRRVELESYRVVHSVAASQLLLTPDPTPEQAAKWDRAPSREHPLVWQRRDGRKSLLIGATAGQIVGMDPERSRGLLDEVLDWATQPQFVLRHHWSVGDLVVWDNTGMLHRAIPYEPTSRRLMHRTTLVGEEAIA